MTSPLLSRKAWLLPVYLFAAMSAMLTAIWCAIEPGRLIPLFDNHGASPVELMTLPLFALIVPLVWLCSPFGGSRLRRTILNIDASILAVMAIIRETDLHKMLFAKIWPQIDASFTGTVFKMRFLKAPDIPILPKLFVIAFFVVFFAVVAGTFAYFIVRLVKGIFSLDPVSWTWGAFGGTSVMVLVVDRLPAFLRHNGFDGPTMDKATGSIAALMKVFEEGGEMMMALFALMALLQAHLKLQKELDATISG
ncbi:MAG: hypothetical protein J6P13_05165 [Kiritimatiellae bacterium]|nr:hypothetical protein [Kiritimatiellia bacterium]